MNTHRYIPNADQDIREMLQVIGVDSLDRLFDSLPAGVKLDKPLDLPGPWSEIELRRWIASIASRNTSTHETVSFLGAGSYAHYQPAAVDHLIQRAEFLTSYTPYQPEVSQGTLQSIFEYQTHQCMLTRLDVANASLYDGSTAFVEGVLMAQRVTRGRNKVVVARTIHPQYRETLQTYIQNLDIDVVEVGWTKDGRLDLDALRGALDLNTFAVAVQSPNFFGVIEDYEAIRAATQGAGVSRIAVIAEATSLGIVTPPGDHGFDIAVGEGQAWGIPPQFGGPYVGFMVVKDELKRHMPGRLVGETVDVDGRRAYVLTLATREQHIRRAKATSNICTNQALFALAANIYLSLLGKEGLREVAMQCVQKAAYLRERLSRIPRLSLPFSGPIYNEFLVRADRPAVDLLRNLAPRGILGGVPVQRYFPDQPNDFLVAVTELHTKEQMDSFTSTLSAELV